MSKMNKKEIEIHQHLQDLFPPNNAQAEIIGPLATIQNVQQGLGELGLSAPSQLPSKWDWSEKVNLLPPTNQARCGDCWAQSSTNALTDKFLILKNLKGLELNQLTTTICTYHNFQGIQGGSNHECEGGFPYVAGKFFEGWGAVPSTDKDGKQVTGCAPSWEEWCKGNDGCNNTRVPSCNAYQDCAPVYKAVKDSTTTLTVEKDSKIDPHETINNIKTAILNTGPVIGTFFVYADMQYANIDLTSMGGWKYQWDATNGIYVNGKYNSDMDKLWEKSDPAIKQKIPKMNWGNKKMGAHAVEIVGWNEEGDIPYWIIKNSWADKWNKGNPAGNKGGYWYHAMYPHNQACAMDVPLAYSEIGGLGGCTNFKADVSSGAKQGSIVGPAKSGGSKRGGIVAAVANSDKKHWLWIGLGVIGLLVIFWLSWRFFSKKSGKRKSGRSKSRSKSRKRR